METAALLIQGLVALVVLMVFILAPIREWEFTTVVLNILLGMAWISTLGPDEDDHAVVGVTCLFFGYMLYSWVWLIGIYDGYFSSWVKKWKEEHCR